MNKPPNLPQRLPPPRPGAPPQLPHDARRGGGQVEHSASDRHALRARLRDQLKLDAADLLEDVRVFAVRLENDLGHGANEKGMRAQLAIKALSRAQAEPEYVQQLLGVAAEVREPA